MKGLIYVYKIYKNIFLTVGSKCVVKVRYTMHWRELMEPFQLASTGHSGKIRIVIGLRGMIYICYSDNQQER